MARARRTKPSARGGDSSSHLLIVDRWLDDTTASAELDGQSGVLLPRALLPAEAAPDLVLRVERRASRVTITVDAGATDAARRDSEQLASRLRARDPGGNVAL